MIVGLIGWIPYNAQKDNSEVTIQSLSETHVNYKDAEEHALLLEELSQEAPKKLLSQANRLTQNLLSMKLLNRQLLYKRVQMVSTLMVDISILHGSLVLDKFQQTPMSIDGQTDPSHHFPYAVRRCER